MLKHMEIEAKTLIDAEKQAVNELRIPLDKLKFDIIKEKRGILGIGASTTYLVSANVNLALEGKQYIESILRALEIDAKMELRTLNEGKEISYSLFSEENALLIGKDGKTLKSIQFLVKNYINIFTDEFVLVNLDIGNYNINRKKQLEIVATKTAKEVAKSKIAVKLDPMNAYERRIIHAKLSEWRDVVTESIGEGEERSIVIKPVLK